MSEPTIPVSFLATLVTVLGAVLAGGIGVRLLTGLTR